MKFVFVRIIVRVKSPKVNGIHLRSDYVTCAKAPIASQKSALSGRNQQRSPGTRMVNKFWPNMILTSHRNNGKQIRNWQGGRTRLLDSKPTSCSCGSWMEWMDDVTERCERTRQTSTQLNLPKKAVKLQVSDSNQPNVWHICIFFLVLHFLVYLNVSK